MIRIVADSLGDLPQSVVDEHKITLVPSYVTMGDKTYRDRVDIQPEDFFQLLPTIKALPTTSQASVADFEKAYRSILADDPAAHILSVHCTGALSGSIESGRSARKLIPDAKIEVIDSGAISTGEGLCTLEAAMMASRGASIEEVLIRLEAMRRELKSYFTLNTLDYLAKGGRIGRAARLLGTLLDMKPLLKLENGAIAPDDRHISREKAISALVDKILSAGRGKSEIRLAIAHAVCKDEADKVAETLQSELKPSVLLRGEVGPAIGTYTGPGALGAFIWCAS